MAIFGLQENFQNKILSEYFGLSTPNDKQKELFIGLGVTQLGVAKNLPDFSEVNEGKPLGNYQRARIIFGSAVDGTISNLNDVTFTTASEDWTEPSHVVEMIGIFDTLDYQDSKTKEQIKPLVVLPLQTSVTIEKGETLMLAKDAIKLTLTDL